MNASREPEWLSQELTWVRTGVLSRVHELLAGGELIARLEITGFARRGARLEAGGRAWRIDNRGFLRPRLVVTDPQGHEIAAYLGGWWGAGAVTFADTGSTLRWRRTSWMRREWTFEDEGIPVLRLHAPIAFLAMRIEAGFERRPADEDLALVLLGLAAMLILRARRASAH